MFDVGTKILIETKAKLKTKKKKEKIIKKY